MNETGVKIIIEGDATGAVAAARQASDALAQLQADTAGPDAEMRFHPSPAGGRQETGNSPTPADGRPAADSQSGLITPEAPVPAGELNLPPAAEAGIIAEPNQPAPGLEPALHAALTSPPNPVIPPGMAPAGVNDQPAEPGLGAQPDRRANPPPSAPTGAKPTPVAESEPDDSALTLQPSRPIRMTGSATPFPDAAPMNSAAMEAGGGDARPPGGQPAPDRGREALEKLRELNDLTGRNAMLMTQMFDSMIQSQRAAARIQTAQQAEIKALTAQLQTLLAQMDNTQFNTR